MDASALCSQICLTSGYNNADALTAASDHLDDIDLICLTHTHTTAAASCIARRATFLCLSSAWTRVHNQLAARCCCCCSCNTLLPALHIDGCSACPWTSHECGGTN